MRSSRIVHKVLTFIKHKKKRNAIKLFYRLAKIFKTIVALRSKRVGGVSYKLPIRCKRRKQIFTLLKWIVQSAQKRHDGYFYKRLSGELLDILDGRSNLVRKREEIYKTAIFNLAFMRFLRRKRRFRRLFVAKKSKKTPFYFTRLRKLRQSFRLYSRLSKYTELRSIFNVVHKHKLFKKVSKVTNNGILRNSKTIGRKKSVLKNSKTIDGKKSVLTKKKIQYYANMKENRVDIDIRQSGKFNRPSNRQSLNSQWTMFDPRTW